MLKTNNIMDAQTRLAIMILLATSLAMADRAYVLTRRVEEVLAKIVRTIFFLFLEGGTCNMSSHVGRDGLFHLTFE